MDSTSTELTSDVAVRFSDSSWKTRWLAVGLTVLLLVRCAVIVGRIWSIHIPWWPWLILFGLSQEAFLILFPVLARTPRGWLRIPSVRQCLIEFGIAVVVVLVTEVVFGLINFVVSRLLPGTSLTPDELRQVAESWSPLAILAMSVAAFTVVPIAEEIFFRGFLQNAFQARMPMLVAVLLQASIFGACHAYSVAHSIAAGGLGIVLAMVYRWRKTLVAPILVHAGLNLIAALGVAAMAVIHANSPMLGVRGGPDDTACVIREMVPNSAAEKAGLRVGDTILSFGKQEVHDPRQLVELVQQHQVGETVSVSIQRADELIEVEVILQRRGRP